MHKEGYIYLDYASTTMIDPEIFEEIKDYYIKYYANPSSVHIFGQEVRTLFEKYRAQLAELLGVHTRELIFCSSGTEANNLAIFGTAYANSFAGKHIISTTVEHSSVLAPLAKLESEGYEVTYLHTDFNGIVNLDDLKRSLKKETILVSILIVNNETGVIQPYDEIYKIVKGFNEKILIHYDMVAGFPKIVDNFSSLKADLISISGHKLYAPKGTALLYIKTGTRITPQIVGGEHEFGKRAGTENVPGFIFLCKSIKQCIKESSTEFIRVTNIRNYFEEKLLQKYNDRILIAGKGAKRIPHISNVCFKNLESEGMIANLSKYGICVTSGSACKEDSSEPSHVIVAMGIPYNFAKGSLRFSFGRYTTLDEINYTLEKLDAVISELNKLLV
jgi:cysteine desulfurase